MTLVEVLWNSFISWYTSQVVLWTLDGHEALQDILVQNASRELLGLVAHESIDEDECRLGNFNPGEGEVFGVVSVSLMV